MSRKNEIDELFRSALGDKGMNYAPEYWEQMESLIAKRRQKMLKRAIWFSAGCLLFVIALLLSMPREKGSEERAFGQSWERVDEETRGLGDLEAWRRGDRETGGLGDKEMRGLGDEVDSPFAELVEVNGRGDLEKKRLGDEGKWRQGDKENDIVHHPSEKPALSLPKGSTTDETEPANEVQGTGSGERTFGQSGGAEGAATLARAEGEEGFSDLAETPRRVEGPIPSLAPTSLGTLLYTHEIPTTPLNTQNPKKILRRPPSYTQWYLGSYINYGWIKHRYNPSIHTWKTTNENPQPFMHYGLNIRASKRGFSLSVGTGIRQWTERTNYTRQIDHYTFDTSFKLVDREFIQRPDGSYAALVRKQIDTTSHTTSTEYICPDCPVTFRYFTVPVAVHYEFGRGKWLGFSEAGLTFSFLSKGSGEYSGQWQNEAGKTPGMQTNKLSGKYLSPMVMQAGLTVGISYRIHPFVSINGQIAYQRSLNSMMTLYRQETDFYGLGLGVEWKLF